uniref:Uncharacterized protein n=1 Tax=Panagrolaimus sp. ES5 TaxID=591445 RepID=A0AC34GHA1_9BILA
PKDPVRPVSPVRPISPAGGHSYDSNNQQQQLLKPLPHVDILPLHIPRAKSTPSPRSLGSFNDQNSPKSAQSYGHSPRSGRSSGFGSAGTPGRGASPAGSNISANNGSGIPMKKVIRKTRLVSIHDGRPVSPYVETVTYEPVIKLPPPSRTTIIRDSGEDYTSSDENNDRKQQHKNRK